jgi:outer membrane lipoprotein
MVRLYLIIGLFVCCTACAHVMSKDALSLVDKSLSYRELRAHPDSYLGKYVLVGGTVAAVRNMKDGSHLEIVQANLDSRGYPEDTYESGGRFLAITSDFLDPEKFKSGRRVTVIGEVKGLQVRKIDEIDYTYPVIAIRELHLWRPEQQTSHYYPNPAYPYYWYDPAYYWSPYWYDPWFPRRYNRPGPWRW